MQAISETRARCIFEIKMKRSEFKTYLRPLIEEVLRDALLEGGFLQKIITETARSMHQGFVLSEQKREILIPSKEEEQETTPMPKPRLTEAKKRLIDKIGNEAYAGVFEGVAPVSSADSQPSYSALRDTDPLDPGIPIDGIMKIAGGKQKWQAHMGKK
jgi:hypothetical protein